MANVYLNLPVPAGNGTGAAVDTSGLSSQKTFEAVGEFAGAIQVQVSNDGGASFMTIATLTTIDRKIVVNIVAQWMRLVREGAGVPAGPISVFVSAEPTDKAEFATFAIPSVGQTSPVISLATAGGFHTIIATGTFNNVFGVEITQNGVDWIECMTFPVAGVRSKVFTALGIRLRKKSTGGGSASFSIGSLPDEAESGESTDEKVKVTADDTTTSYLADKVGAGLGIDLTIDTPGGDETLVIAADITEINAELARGIPIPVRGPNNDLGTDDDKLAAFDHQHRLEVEVEDEGALRGARPRLNFIGDGVGAVDNPGLDKIDITIPGPNLGNGGAVVKRSLYLAPQVSTSSLVYVDGMAGGFVTVPIDGAYWVMFEGEADNQSASIDIEIGISVDSLIAVVAGSERKSRGPAADKRPVVTTVQIPGLIAGQKIRCLFRKQGPATPATVNMYRRHLTIIKVQ